MRELIASLIIVAVLIGSWLVFDSYSKEQLTGFAQVIEEDIIPAVEGEDWETGAEYMEALAESWEKYKKAALIFIGTAEINQIDCSIARSEKYVAAGDVSNSSGELISLVNQLTVMHAREDINIENVF